MLEMNAFKSSTKRSHEQLLTDIDNLGGVVQCMSTREHIFYCIDILRENAEQAVDILAETILLATYPDKEIEEAKDSFVWNYDATPGPNLSRDAAVMASCSGEPLGNPFFIPEDRMPLLNADTVRHFKSQHYFGSNCLISGAGIDHDTLVKLVGPRFSSLPTLPSSSSPYVPRPPSKYTGGLYKNERELKEPFTRVAIGFKCGGWASEDIVTICVTQILLGGGSSFSAGGPGKGMYSRLYREVLNRCYWVESAETFFAAHDDFGVFGIDASCDLEHLAHLIQISISELVRLSVEPVKPDELSRAKNMVKSLLMSNLESRTITCEDIARQFITLGYREESPSLLKKIDAVTADDILRLAQKMIITPPSVGCVGPDLQRVPKYEDIRRFTENTVTDAMSKAGLPRPNWPK